MHNNRIFVLEGININKTTNSHEDNICCFSYSFNEILLFNQMCSKVSWFDAKNYDF